MDLNKKTGFYKKYIGPSAVLIAVIWFLVWKFDYDKYLGVFDKGTLGAVATAVIILFGLACAFPYYFWGKLGNVSPNLVKTPGLAGALGSMLCGVFTFFCGLNPIISGNCGTFEIVIAILAVPSAAYFIILSMGREKLKNVESILVFFPIVWGVAEVLFNYFSADRAINDPKKIFLQFMPIAIMIYILSEAKVRYAECPTGTYIATCSVAVIIGAVGLSLSLDGLIDLIMKLLANAGVPVSSTVLALNVNKTELYLDLSSASLGIYAYGRLKSVITDKNKTAESEEPAEEK